MNKKILGLAAIISLGAIGGFALVNGANSLEENLAGNTPLTSSNGYTLTIDGNNPLAQAGDNWTAKTTNGNAISFGTVNVVATTDSAFKISSTADSTGGIYNTTPIQGIKSIKFTIAAGEWLTRADNYHVYFGYSSFPKAASSNDYDSYMTVKDTTSTEIVIEYTFNEEIAPNYFAFTGRAPYASSTNPNVTTVTSVEINYSCSETSKDLASVTVSNEAQLQLALEYYKNYSSSNKGTIVLADDIDVTRSLKAQGTSAYPIDITFDLAGHTLRAKDGVDFANEYRNSVIAVSIASTITITGNGTIDSSGYKSTPVSFSYRSNTSAAKINIESGTFKSYTGLPAVLLSGSSSESTSSGTLTIKGGTFIDGNSATNASLISTAEGMTSTISITGGAFVGYDPSSYVTDTETYTVYSSEYSSGVTQYEVVAKTQNVATADEFNEAAKKLASSGGTINITSDFSYSTALVINGDITVDGNNHTIKPTADFSVTTSNTRPATIMHESGTLKLNNLIVDFSDLTSTDYNGIASYSCNMDMYNVKVGSFSDNAINSYKRAVLFYDRGECSMTSCSVNASSSYDQYYYAEIWAGAAVNLTIDQGAYHRIFINAYEHPTAHAINSGSLTVKAYTGSYSIIDEVVLECATNALTWTGKTSAEGETQTFTAGSLVYHANLTVEDSDDVKTVTYNPSNITGVTATRGTDGKYVWSFEEGATGKYFVENVTDLTYAG